MSLTRKCIWVVLALVPALTSGLGAQGIPSIAVFGGGMALRVRETGVTGTRTLTSNQPVGAAILTFGPFALDGSYTEGSLTPQAGAATPRDLVEAKAFAGFRIFRGFRLSAGGQARGSVLPSGTRRLILWALRGTVETPIAGSIATARVDIWTAFAGRSNIAETLDHARGGEAALTLHVPRTPLWGKLAYRVERAQFDNALRAETVEGLLFTVGVGLPGF